jgi:hypothetical protein
MTEENNLMYMWVCHGGQNVYRKGQSASKEMVYRVLIYGRHANSVESTVAKVILRVHKSSFLNHVGDSGVGSKSRMKRISLTERADEEYKRKNGPNIPFRVLANNVAGIPTPANKAKAIIHPDTRQPIQPAFPPSQLAIGTTNNNARRSRALKIIDPRSGQNVVERERERESYRRSYPALGSINQQMSRGGKGIAAQQKKKEKKEQEKK